MRVSFACAVAAAVLLHGRIEAQRVQGEVSAEDDGRPLGGAHIAVLTAADSVIASSVSAANGRFGIDLPEPGHYRLRVQSIGYTSLTTDPLHVAARTVITLELRLRADAIALAPLRVVAERVEPPFMHDVRFRHRTGIGTLITREQLDERFGSNLEDVLRDTGVKITYVPIKENSQRSVPLVSGRQNSARECFMSVFVNGRREFPLLSLGDDPDREESLERLWEVFHFKPQDVEAVEIFRGAGQVPAEFSDITSECGVVAFWLRDAYRSVAETGPYLGPLPRISVNVTGASSTLTGKHAPGGGVAVEVASLWDVGRGVGIGVGLRHGTHPVSADTMHALMRLATAVRMGLFTAAVEPRVVLLRQWRVRPVIAARLQLTRRSFDLPYDYVEGEANFVSLGWGWGAAAGAELALTRRVAIEVAATRDRLHFGEYGGLETPRRHTATNWTVSGVRVGLATRF